MKTLKTILLLLLSVCLNNLFAQDEGGIPDVEIQIVNPLKVTLPKADRNFAKVPAMPAEPISPPMVYDYSLVSFLTPSYSPAVRPLRLKPTEATAYRPGFISAGFGNYISPYLKGYISFFPAKSLTTGGLSFHHHSFGTGKVDDKNSSSGFTSVAANIKSAGKVATTEVLAGFEDRAGNFYGYVPGSDVSKDTIKQAYQTYFLSGSISNSKASDFNYEIRPSFSYLKDKYSAKETDFSLGVNTLYKMKEGGISVNARYSLIAREDSEIESQVRHLFSVTPQYQFKLAEKFSLNVGATVAFENDSIGKSDFHVYPAISSHYSIGNNFNLFAKLGGDIDKVGLHSLSRDNLWINPNVSIFHTNKALEFSGGIVGNLGNLSATAGFTLSQLKNYFLFQNDSINQAKFNVIYDDVTRSNLFLGLNFDKGNYSFRVRGDYYNYTTQTQQEAWHRPQYTADVSVGIKAGAKLSIVPRFMVMGGMKAFDFSIDEIIELPLAVDFGVNSEYSFSDRVGVFIKLSNLLNSNYSLYNNYPVRGIQGLAGFTWKF